MPTVLHQMKQGPPLNLLNRHRNSLAAQRDEPHRIDRLWIRVCPRVKLLQTMDPVQHGQQHQQGSVRGNASPVTVVSYAIIRASCWTRSAIESAARRAQQCRSADDWPHAPEQVITRCWAGWIATIPGAAAFADLENYVSTEAQTKLGTTHREAASIGYPEGD
jgi:hypothetical protein